MRWNFSANNTDMLVEKANSIIDNTLSNSVHSKI